MKNTLLAILSVFAVLTARVQAQSPSYDWSLQVMQAMGSTIQVESAPLSQLNGNQPLTSGTIHFVALNLLGFPTISGVVWDQDGPSSFIGTGFNGVALYAYNPATGILTEQMFSANDPAYFQGIANTLQYIPFTGPQALSGVYFVAYLSCYSSATHAPRAFGISSFSGTTSSLMPNGGMLGGSLASQASFPASLSISSLTPESPIWAGLY